MTARAIAPAGDGGAAARVGLLWRHRELVRGLVARNLTVKYKRSLLGFVWTLLNPLITVLVLVAVFGHVVRVPVAHYWAFVLSGYFVWNFVSQSLSAGTYVFAEHSRLLRSAAFPAESLVVGATVAKLIEFLGALLPVVVGVCAFHHGRVPASLVLLPLLVLIQLLLVLGLTLPIATLSVFYHDVYHALPIALATLFYVSPVFYPVSLVPAQVLPLYMLNPVAGVLALYHTVLYEGRFPSPALLGGVLAAAAAICWVGYAIFRRHAAVYAEVV